MRFHVAVLLARFLDKIGVAVAAVILDVFSILLVYMPHGWFVEAKTILAYNFD